MHTMQSLLHAMPPPSSPSPSPPLTLHPSHALVQRQEDKVTVYMGVPTMYSYLLAQYDEAPKAEQQKAR